ncbi:LysR family transcriptional regulator [Kushneria aurantia]|uniref:LysR family transcriptional regulator n=1 Tax=Kushneria aurantia TaxID=504092 RepID=A0ABV6G4U6_9GAMM|nr:LysR family transcriptional regulator [Kushneria aurantia]
MFDFKELEAFVWIVRLGSFRLAASHLNLTQPSISDRISRLESSVGHTLLERHRRPMRPTRRGQEFLDHAERMLAARQLALGAMQSPDLYRGRLRLGIVESLALSWLPAFISTCATHYPELTIEFELDITPRVFERLLNHDIDLAFMVGPVSNDNLISRPLCHYPTRLVVSSRIIADPTNCSASDLAGIDFIAPSRHSLIYRTVRNFMVEHDLDSAPLHGSSSLSMIIHLVRQGLGIGALPQDMAQQAIAAGEVVALPFELPGIDFIACRLNRADDDLAHQLMSVALSTALLHGETSLPG